MAGEGGESRDKCEHCMYFPCCRNWRHPIHYKGPPPAMSSGDATGGGGRRQNRGRRKMLVEVADAVLCHKEGGDVVGEEGVVG